MAQADDDLLAEMQSKSSFELITLIGDLAHSRGESGVPALKEFIRSKGPGSEDRKCVAIFSLAQRCGPDASRDLLEAFTESRGITREFAAEALWEVADDRIWDDLLAWYQEWLARPKSRRKPIPPAMPLSYLVAQAAGDVEKTRVLVTLLRDNWSRLIPFEQQWISSFVAEAEPDGPPVEEVRLPGRAELPLRSGLVFGDPHL